MKFLNLFVESMDLRGLSRSDGPFVIEGKRLQAQFKGEVCC